MAETEEKNQKEKIVIPKTKETDGGSKRSKRIAVAQTPKEPVEVETEDTREEGEVEEEQYEPSPESMMVNEALVETCAKVIGKTASLITRIPEMDFDEGEVEQLKALWSPLVPVMSPLLTAVMGTAILVLGKVAIYASLHKEKPPKEVKLESLAVEGSSVPTESV